MHNFSHVFCIALYSRPEKAFRQSFSTTLFCDWKHATGSKGMLLSHNNCISHNQAVVAWSLIFCCKNNQDLFKKSDD